MVVDPHFAHFAKRERGRINTTTEQRARRQWFHKPFILENESERLSIGACHLFLMNLGRAVVQKIG
jgi:hypothetical protein